MVNIVREDDQSIQLHPTAVGLKTSRESRNDQEAFMVAYFKSSDDSNSLYAKYSNSLHFQGMLDREHQGESLHFKLNY